MATRGKQRQMGKLVRVRNMLNRIMMKKRFTQWVNNVHYILSIADAGDLAQKIIVRRRLRNNLAKLRAQVKKVKRAEHIEEKVNWFRETRARNSSNDCFQSWRLFVKRFKLAKRFLFRSANGIDRQLCNQAFGVWKQMCSQLKQRVFVDNIQELKRRKAGHEDQIKKFKVLVEQNESKQKHLKSKMQSQAQRIMGNFIVRMNMKQTARGFYKWHDVVHLDSKRRRFIRKAILYWHRRSLGSQFRKWAEASFKLREA
jgi:hypothetical protein